MAAKSRRTTSKTKRISFKAGASKKKKTKHRLRLITSLISSFKISIMVCILGSTAIGLIYLDRYRIKTAPPQEGQFSLELAADDTWVNDELRQKVLDAGSADLEDLRIDENAAATVHQNINSQVAWLDDLKVKATHNALRIEGRWRKPMGLIKIGRHSFYVDAEQVVLDFIQISTLPIVEITGLPTTRKMPP
ncbi:MAG: hypothetical protein ACYSR9_13200, partial [Planctomycetota bacterium]